MKKVLFVLLLAGAMLLASCTDSGSATNDSDRVADGSIAVDDSVQGDKEDAVAQRDEQLAADFADYFQDRWQTVEGAADGMALPKGQVFFTDLDGAGMPECFVTYSTGGGKQTGLLVYELGGAKPVELGGAYLPIAPPNTDGLEFSLWGDNESRVLYTQGIVLVGGANPVRVTTECFLILSDGQLVCNEMTYSTTPEETTYYSSPFDAESISQAAYEKLRSEYLHSLKPCEFVKTGKTVDFLLNSDAFADAVCAALMQWRRR